MFKRFFSNVLNSIYIQFNFKIRNCPCATIPRVGLLSLKTKIVKHALLPYVKNLSLSKAVIKQIKASITYMQTIEILSRCYISMEAYLKTISHLHIPKIIYKPQKVTTEI